MSIHQNSKKLTKHLFVLPSDALGGAEQVLKMIATHYADNNDVTVFFLEQQKAQAWSDSASNMTLIYGSSSRYLGMLKLLRFIISNKKWEKVFASQVYINGLLGILKAWKVLICNHLIVRESTSVAQRFTGLKLKLYKLFYKLGYKNTELIICQTDSMQQQLFAFLPWTKNLNTKVIPNPIDIYKIKKLSMETINIEAIYGKYIVSAGRLISEKGYDILIKAFRKVNIEYPHLNLLILGEGNQRAALEQLISDNDWAEKVFLPGFEKNVNPYFKQAEVCVVSSRIEGFPNVLLQMMANNDKVVSTKCAGGIDLIKGVITVNTENEEELANAILNSLKMECKENRALFDRELDKRSIDNFIQQIDENVH